MYYHLYVNSFFSVFTSISYWNIAYKFKFQIKWDAKRQSWIFHRNSFYPFIANICLHLCIVKEKCPFGWRQIDAMWRVRRCSPRDYKWTEMYLYLADDAFNHKVREDGRCTLTCVAMSEMRITSFLSGGLSQINSIISSDDLFSSQRWHSFHWYSFSFKRMSRLRLLPC